MRAELECLERQALVPCAQFRGDTRRRPPAEAGRRNWPAAGIITVGITAGASCPNNLIADTIRRLFDLRGISVQSLLAN